MPEDDLKEKLFFWSFLDLFCKLLNSNNSFYFSFYSDWGIRVLWELEATRQKEIKRMATKQQALAVANDMARKLKLPPRFIQDCLECDCDVGDYRNGILNANLAQLAELRSRAEYYADAYGPDAAPAGLKGAAKALLKALDKAGA